MKLILITVIPAAFFIISWFCSRSRKTIPPTHHATGVLYAICILAVSLSVFLFSGAITCWRLCLYAGFSTLRMAACAAICITPMALMLFFIRFWIMGLKGLKRQNNTEPNLPNHPEVVKNFEDLMTKMTLRHAVKLITLQKNRSSPHVFANPDGSATLVVPHDLPGMCMAVCHNDPTLSRALLRLVLSHELCHVASSDIRLLPLLSVFRVVTMMTAGLAAVILINLKIMSDSALGEIIYPVFALCMVTWILVLMAEMWIRRVREASADAASSLYVTPEELIRLTDSEGHASALERFLFSLSIFAAPRSSLMKHASLRLFFTVPAKPMGMSIARLREQTVNRGDALTNSSYLLPHYQSQYISTLLFASAIGAVLYCSIAAVRRMAVMMYDLPHLLDGRWSLSAIINVWIYEDSWVSTLVFTLAPLSAASAVSLIICLPLRDSFSEELRVAGPRLYWIGSLIVLCAATTHILSQLFIPCILPSSIPDMAFPVTGIPCGILVIFFACGTAAFVVVKWTNLFDYPHRFAMQSIGFWAGLLLVPAFVFLVCTRITIMGRFILTMMAMFVAIPFPIKSMPLFVGYDYLEYEWLDYGIVPFWRQIKVSHPSYHNRYLISDLLLGIGHGALNNAIFAIIVAMAGYWGLLRAVTWVQCPEFVLHHKLWADAIAVMNQAFKVPASVSLLGLALIPVLFLETPLMLYGSTLSPVSPYIRLSRTFILSRLSKLIKNSFVSSGLINKTMDDLALAPITGIMHVARQFRIPCFRTTSEVATMCYAEASDLLREKLTSCVMRYSASNGGFGCEPGASPDPLHTFSAIRYLSVAGQLTEEIATVHRRWLTERLMQLVSGSAGMPAPAFLAEMSLILESLTLFPDGLGPSFPVEMRQQILACVIRDWRQGPRTIADARNALVAAQCLDIFESSGLQDEIRSPWFEISEALMVRMDPRTQLEPILQMVEIEAILHPGSYRERDAVCRVASNLQNVHNPA